MAASAPTGCFKCGRPGHWSKDCPSSSSNPNPNPNPNSKFSSSKFIQQQATPSEKEKPSGASATKKAPRTRPKLTPDLLLSDGGLGYILRHFPRSFKNHGRGHEVTDLGNLIGLYAEWHSRLLPYFSFDQFVHKVEQVGATKRVKRCVSELRERVARGEDPTKLNEPQAEEVAPTCEQGVDMEDQNVDAVDPTLEDQNVDAVDPTLEDQNVDAVDPTLESHVANGMHEEMIDEVYQMATNEVPQRLEVTTNQVEVGNGGKKTSKASITGEQISDQVEVGDSASNPSKVHITEEQKARMEANRHKALERAAARALSTHDV